MNTTAAFAGINGAGVAVIAGNARAGVHAVGVQRMLAHTGIARVNGAGVGIITVERGEGAGTGKTGIARTEISVIAGQRWMNTGS